MSTSSFTEFQLPKNSYVTFDATSIKELIIERLKTNEVFRDQVFEGSNLNAFIDIVAYMYHVLLFYLNTTSSETTFTTATLYENINKLVSNLGYKPTGKQTSLANISLSATSGLSQNNYVLRRFSTIFTNGIPYTTVDDISFEKITSGNEALSIDNNLLLQGTLLEHPPYTATGEEYETITVVNQSPNSQEISFISDNSFSVFVKSSQSGRWSEWQETSSLFLVDSNSPSYEKRYNENGNYEFKFGNGINGTKLTEGDIVQIYYVFSNGERGVIGPGRLFGNFFALYNSPQFNSIVTDIYDSETNFIAGSNLSFILTNNPNNSSPISEAETAEQIKNNAPKIFSTQNRLVTSADYESFINRSFNNIIKSVKVLSNEEYINTVLRYYYSIGLNQPNEDCRVLFNQVNFSNSTSFNNVYVIGVTKVSTIVNEQVGNYLNSSQKQLIVNECSSKRDLTHNVVILDPIFKAFSIAVQQAGESECVDLKDSSVLVIKKDNTVKISANVLKQAVVKIFTDYFNNATLGQNINFNLIASNILNINGVKSIATRRTDTNYEIPRLSMVVWNPLYKDDDVTITTQNIILNDSQFPFFYEISKLSEKIIIENE